MKLKISTGEARTLILSIPHRTCSGAVDEHWKVRADGTVHGQSILWLFCWAKTGMNSEAARTVAIQVFDQILPIRFSDCDHLIDHQYARENRYTNRFIDAELEVKLAPVPNHGDCLK